jgi:hypothetical protein
MLTHVALRISHTTVDSLDAYAQSVWWCGLLGYAEDPDDPNERGHEECMIYSPDRSHVILFLDVPDAKQVKNRMHFDLRPTDRTRDEEIERVRALGASDVDDLRLPNGGGWLVMADPEGNECCILRSEAELT